MPKTESFILCEFPHGMEIIIDEKTKPLKKREAKKRTHKPKQQSKKQEVVTNANK